MAVLTEVKPERVFHFFEELCKIPHGTFDTKRISDYCVAFAKERGLEVEQDEANDVIIKKPGTPGYENSEPVILQGHMDMVAVKKPDCPKDMTKEGLDLKVDGDFLYAEGTSLGGDDGIAVAYALALLDSQTIEHPRLEVVITVDEETGMEGANAIDLSMCQARRMLNLDNEEEGVLLTSCAGGARIHGTLAGKRERRSGRLIEIGIEGLLGGHSGAEIDKGRANANVLRGRLLEKKKKKTELQLLSVEGGSADNAIPSACHASVCVQDAGCVIQAAEELEAAVKKEYAATDAGIHFQIQEKEEGDGEVFSQDMTDRAIRILYLAPNGIQRMSADIPGLVQTSLNLGILKTEEEKIGFDYSVRSSMGSEKETIIDRVCLLLSSQGASYEVSGEYPAWEYRQESPLREKMVAVYERLYGQAPRIEAIHAGLECGILAGKIPGLDCVSIGPDMRDIHTPEEKLSISSTKRVWEYILEVLKK